MKYNAYKQTRRFSDRQTALRRHLTRFRKEEDGSIIVFTLFILVLMLIVSGMAVDFMRFEAKRSLMQGAVDGAVLAAADLDQINDSATVATDYITKSPVGNCLSEPVYVSPPAQTRTVSAKCSLTMDTFFLRLIGMDTLTAHARSTATEGVGEIEISLVVDISGSMDDPIPDTTERKIDKLETAATGFVDALLVPQYADRISISLVPYSEHVNIGPDLYATLNTNTRHGFSHCVEIPASEYTTSTWNNSVVYEQTQHFQWNPHYIGSSLAANITEPVCPQYSFERVIPLSQNPTTLKTAIQSLEPRSGTSIFLGLKWGITLLDPSFRSNIAALPNGVIDPAFAGRPADYPSNGQATSTVKYVVLMTDGENQSSNRLNDWAYDTPSEIAHWNTMNWWYFVATTGGWRNSNNALVNQYTYQKYNQTIGDGYMQSMCTQARNLGITVFAIAMDSTPHGKVQMSQCATDPSYYYETTGATLTQIFADIADQITDLRLTQ